MVRDTVPRLTYTAMSRDKVLSWGILRILRGIVGVYMNYIIQFVVIGVVLYMWTVGG